MNINQLIEKGVKELIEANIESPVQKNKILLANLLNKPKEYLLINENNEIDDSLKNNFIDKINKLKKNYPIQYLINKQEFMKLDFYVDENVLIPQPDTEILVEEVINIIENSNTNKKINILDLCTGSGAIGISISKYTENSIVTMTDISEKALEIAKENAKKHKVIQKCKFINSDMFNNIQASKYDIIVSNPPYIETKIIKTLDEQVKKEPILALDGGKDGLDFYRNIAKNSYKFLNNNGYLALEIGYNQKDKVIDLLEKEEKYVNIYSKKDLSGNDRIVVCMLK